MFEVVRKRSPHPVRITEPRFCITKTRSFLTGILRLPPKFTEELGWAADTQIEILKGTEEHAGWYQIRPTSKGRKLRHKQNGVMEIVSTKLVADEIQEAQKTVTPASQIENGSLFVKLA